jgi:hypothetical protein
MDFLNTDEKKERRLVHNPMGRFGEAIEQAYAALYLASDESSYVTGTDFLVDGGLTAACEYLCVFHVYVPPCFISNVIWLLRRYSFGCYQECSWIQQLLWGVISLIVLRCYILGLRPIINHNNCGKCYCYILFTLLFIISFKV